VPHDQLAVQWDVAVEFGILEAGFGAGVRYALDDIVDRLVRCVERVPTDVPVGFHSATATNSTALQGARVARAPGSGG
jgi:hypothetical protein